MELAQLCNPPPQKKDTEAADDICFDLGGEVNVPNGGQLCIVLVLRRTTPAGDGFSVNEDGALGPGSVPRRFRPVRERG